MSPRRPIPTADRISTLPDTVLCHILSFLPTKLAVATSILSKRWRPLWLSVPTLDFDDQSFANNLRFLHFVYSVIVSRDTTLPVQSFRLKCGQSSLCAPSDINRWVYAAVQRGVEHLHLDLAHKTNFRDRMNLPPSVLSCKTLVVLKLNGLTVNALPYVDFPLLKTLHLEWISFENHGYLMKLLSGCPVLEDLQTRHLLVGSHRSEGEVQSLPKLVRADISNLFIPFTLLHNVGFLRAELECSYYKDVPTFHNLTHMELVYKPNMWHWDWLAEVLERCPKLQNLVIDKRLLYRIYDDDWEEPQFVPECLSSQLRTCSFRNYGGLECELQFARYIMQNSRVLQTMTIQSTFCKDPNITLQMLMKLSLCPRSSATCKLIFK